MDFSNLIKCVEHLIRMRNYYMLYAIPAPFFGYDNS